MFVAHRPTQSEIDRFLSRQAGQPFSYSQVGASRRGPPAGYTVDHNRVRLGSGAQVFRDAVAALRAWRMFALPWLRLLQPNTPVEPGATVAIMVRHFGFWSLNACRVVYVFEEERSQGFAYGTLPEHAEKGEERFSVEWAEDQSVFYDILAFSKPARWQARLAHSLTRRVQRRFARDSMAAMSEAVGQAGRTPSRAGGSGRR